jgi:putative membrane protein
MTVGNLIDMPFLYLKAFHLIAVVCWFAALFYLPRLFVYHAMSEDTPSLERFKIMERKLYRGIMTPSAIATVVLGFAMLHLNQDYYSTVWWIKIKLVLVLLLVCYHAACGYFVRQFAEDKNTRSHTFFRVFNEVPVVLLIAIVMLAVLRPF